VQFRLQQLRAAYAETGHVERSPPALHTAVSAASLRWTLVSASQDPPAAKRAHALIVGAPRDAFGHMP